ncbi:MAG: hypothetical protein IPK33_33115 [Gemmatimonadetes bacterium]|nr:hypothetical protein [Gemmatimonadota bacterium]
MADPKDTNVVYALNVGFYRSKDGGKTFRGSTYNDYPYLICGAQQDNSTLCGPSRGEGRVNISDWKDAGGGESGYVTPHPTKPHIVFAGSYGRVADAQDMRTGFTRDITVYPINPMGYSSRTSRSASSGLSPSSSRATTTRCCTRQARSSSAPRTKGRAGPRCRPSWRAATPRRWTPLGRPDHQGPDGRRDLRPHLRLRRVPR